MENYFVLDFYCQNESGLKKDIKQSGVSNIDPWEDMEEDFNFIQQYLLPAIDLVPIDYVLFKSRTKYILRILCEATENIELYIEKKQTEIVRLVKYGWSPFSIKGIPFKCMQIQKKENWDDMKKNAVELKETKNICSQVYSIN